MQRRSEGSKRILRREKLNLVKRQTSCLNPGRMKILVIGSGGREHALVWRLAQSPRVTQMWCAPGNAGIAAELLAGRSSTVECADLSADNLPGLLAFARVQRPDLTVVGPDNPLALGVVDLFQENGLRIWGPNRKAAQFESSKVFAQNFMATHGISTAVAASFTDAANALDFAGELNGRCAVKADGLALGKGVLICTSMAEASRAIDEMLVRQAGGGAMDAPRACSLPPRITSGLGKKTPARTPVEWGPTHRRPF